MIVGDFWRVLRAGPLLPFGTRVFVSAHSGNGPSREKNQHLSLTHIITVPVALELNPRIGTRGY